MAREAFTVDPGSLRIPVQSMWALARKAGVAFLDAATVLTELEGQLQGWLEDAVVASLGAARGQPNASAGLPTHAVLEAISGATFGEPTCTRHRRTHT